MRPSRSTSMLSIPILLAGLLLVTQPPDAGAQKPTIQPARGSSGGSLGRGTSTRRLQPVSPRSSGGSRGGRGTLSPSRPSRPPTVSPSGPSRARTLSPAFPSRGRGEPDTFVRSKPSSVTSRIDAPAVRSGAGLAGGGTSKRFIRDPERRAGDRDRRLIRDHDRRRTRTFIVLDPFFDPFFHDPFRFRRFHLRRHFLGFGCGFFDQFFLGHVGFFAHDPCFSSFNLFLGWPGIVDPWPGFWGLGFYDWRGRYPSGYEYREGFDDGYSRGYASGRTLGQDPAYDVDLAPDPGSEYDVDRGYVEPASPSYRRGRQAMADGDYASALAAFETYTRETPADPIGHLARGVALTALGHYGKSAEAFRRGLDAYRPYERPYFDVPALFESRSEFRRVEGEVEEYVRNHAGNRDARFVLALLYLFSGDLDPAASLLRGLGGDRYASYLLEGLAED